VARVQVCGQAQPGKEALAHLQQSNAVEWGRPVPGPPDPEVRRLRRMSRYVPAVIRKIVGASNCGQHARYAGLGLGENCGKLKGSRRTAAKLSI